jgi:hypothetical protein
VAASRVTRPANTAFAAATRLVLGGEGAIAVKWPLSSRICRPPLGVSSNRATKQRYVQSPDQKYRKRCFQETKSKAAVTYVHFSVQLRESPWSVLKCPDCLVTTLQLLIGVFQHFLFILTTPLCFLSMLGAIP